LQYRARVDAEAIYPESASLLPFLSRLVLRIKTLTKLLQGSSEAVAERNRFGNSFGNSLSRHQLQTWEPRLHQY
jgi:hypothetical protein